MPTITEEITVVFWGGTQMFISANWAAVFLSPVGVLSISVPVKTSEVQSMAYAKKLRVRMMRGSINRFC